MAFVSIFPPWGVASAAVVLGKTIRDTPQRNLMQELWVGHPQGSGLG